MSLVASSEKSPLIVSGGNGGVVLGGNGEEEFPLGGGYHTHSHSSLNSEGSYRERDGYFPGRRRRRTSSGRRTSFRFSECDGDGDIPQFHGKRGTQYFSALAANMGAFALGTVLSWSAVALPSMRKDEDFKESLTESAETWVGSIITLGAVAAGPAAGYAIESWGRRRTMLILTFPFLLGWLLIFISTNIEMVLAGRFITGLCSGVFAVAAPIFTAEMADVSIRGTLCAGFDCMISIGILFIFLIGSFLGWRVQALVCAVFPIVIFAMMLFVPESPRWLVANDKFELAEEALRKFRGAEFREQIEPELTALKQTIRAHSLEKGEKSGLSQLFTGPVMRPVSIAFFIYFFQVFSGIDPVLFYTVDIFHSAGADIDDYYSTIIIGSVQVVFAAVGAFMVEMFGRRLLLMLSEFVMVLSLGTLGLYFYEKAENGGVPPEGLWGYLPLASLIVYTIAYSVGVGPVGYMIMGEILPHNVKGLAGCILTSLKWFMSFMMTKFFTDLIAFVGNDGCYWLFSGFCLLGLLYIFLCVPETKGKTLDEIQLEFQPKDKKGKKNSSVCTPLKIDMKKNGYQSLGSQNV